MIEALTAAAEKIDVTRRDLRIKPRDWQKRAWYYYHEIPEVRSAARYMADAMSRLKLFVGAYIDGELVQLDPEEPAEGFNPQEIEQAQLTLHTLDHPHGLAEIQRAAALNLFQTGELYLLGKYDEEDPTEQLWEVCSISQIESDTEGVKYRETDTSRMGQKLAEDTVVLRIWRRDPEWPANADSAINASSLILDELLLLTQSIEATATSRIPAGMLAIDQNIEVVQVDSEQQSSSFVQQMMEHMSRPIQDPKSAARLVPFILRGPGDVIKDGIRLIEFHRDIDKLAIELRQECIQRFAVGIDLPAEILTGRADLNHWTSWSIDENAYANHIAPFALMFTNALSYIYLQPALESAQINEPERFVIGADETDLVSKPDQSETVFWAHENFLLSDDSARTELNFSDEQAPEPEEVQARVQRAIAIARRGNAEEAPVDGPPEQEDSRVAAGDNGDFDPAELESSLRLQLQSFAEAAMQRAMEKAGARLRTAAQKDTKAKAIVASGYNSDEVIPNEQLAAQCPGLVAAVGSTPQELLAESFTNFGKQWDNLTGQAQQRLLQLAEGGLTKGERSEAERILNESRSNAWPLLLAALVGLGSELMFNPHPDAPEIGEFDPNTTVPPGMIRGSLGLAGGAALTLSRKGGGGVMGTSKRPVSGFYTSPHAMRIFGQAKNLEIGPVYRWVTGHPQRPFEDHQRLGGKTFSRWDDPMLTAHAGWIHSGFYHPGDHAGCQCDWTFDVKGKQR